MRGRYLYSSVGVEWCGDEVCDCHWVFAQRIYERGPYGGVMAEFIDLPDELQAFHTDGEMPTDDEIKSVIDHVRAAYPNDEWRVPTGEDK